MNENGAALPLRSDDSERIERHHRRIAADVARARQAINELFDQRPEWKPREIQEEACVRARVGRGAASIAFNEMAGDNGEVEVDENLIARRRATTPQSISLPPSDRPNPIIAALKRDAEAKKSRSAPAR